MAKYSSLQVTTPDGKIWHRKCSKHRQYSYCVWIKQFGEYLAVSYHLTELNARLKCKDYLALDPGCSVTDAGVTMGRPIF